MKTNTEALREFALLPPDERRDWLEKLLLGGSSEFHVRSSPHAEKEFADDLSEAVGDDDALGTKIVDAAVAIVSKNFYSPAFFTCVSELRNQTLWVIESVGHASDPDEALYALWNLIDQRHRVPSEGRHDFVDCVALPMSPYMLNAKRGVVLSKLAGFARDYTLFGPCSLSVYHILLCTRPNEARELLDLMLRKCGEAGFTYLAMTVAGRFTGLRLDPDLTMQAVQALNHDAFTESYERAVSERP